MNAKKSFDGWIMFWQKDKHEPIPTTLSEQLNLPFSSIYSVDKYRTKCLSLLFPPNTIRI